MKHSSQSRAAKAQAIDLVKDALGAFAIMTMLYVGLFIPAL